MSVQSTCFSPAGRYSSTADASVAAEARVHAYIERERHPLGAEFLEPCANDVGRSHGEAADHDAVSDCERLLEAITVADAAPELHAQAGALPNAGDQGEVHRRTSLCAVEVHDVEPAGAEPAVPRPELDGVDGIVGLALEVALEQPHAPSVP
jgi:hypothetical protein